MLGVIVQEWRAVERTVFKKVDKFSTKELKQTANSVAADIG